MYLGLIQIAITRPASNSGELTMSNSKSGSEISEIITLIDSVEQVANDNLCWMARMIPSIESGVFHEKRRNTLETCGW
jgi:hypothetical protein